MMPWADISGVVRGATERAAHPRALYANLDHERASSKTAEVVWQDPERNEARRPDTAGDDGEATSAKLRDKTRDCAAYNGTEIGDDGHESCIVRAETVLDAISDPEVAANLPNLTHSFAFSIIVGSRS